MLRKMLHAGFGNVGSHVVNVALLPVISRLYPPGEYAAWVVLMAGVVIFGSISSLRYELAIVLPESEEDASALFWWCFLLAAGIAGACALGLLIPSVRGFVLPTSASAWEIAAVPVLIFLAGAIPPLRMWNVRRGRFAALSVSQMTFVAGLCTTQVLYGWWVGPESVGLVLGSVMGHVLAIAALLVAGDRVPSARRAMFRRIWPTALEHRRFFLFSSPHTLLSVVRELGAIYLIEKFLSSTVVGLYALAYRVVYMPVGPVTQAIQPVIFQRAAASGIASVEQPANTIVRGLSIAVGPAILLLVFHHDWLFSTAFGTEWAGSGPLAVIMIWVPCATILTGWMDRLYDVLGLQRVSLVLEAVGTTLSIAVLSVGLYSGLPLATILIPHTALLVAYNLACGWVIYSRSQWSVRLFARGLGIFCLASGASASLLAVTSSLLSPVLSIGVYLSCLGAVALAYGRRLTELMRGASAQAAGDPV